jgi:hypothetical protein
MKKIILITCLIFLSNIIYSQSVNSSAFRQKVGNTGDSFSYYIDSDSILYVMGNELGYYDLSESRYRFMNKHPMKVPINEKVIKIATITNSSNNLYILTSSGNIWNLQYDSFHEVDNSKIPPLLVDGSGTNIDILDGGIVLKRDENYYVMENLSQEEIIINDIIFDGLDLTLKQKSAIKNKVRDWVTDMREFDVRPIPSYYSNIKKNYEDAYNMGLSRFSDIDIPRLSQTLEDKKSKLKTFFNERFTLVDKPVDQNFIQSVCKKYFKSNSQIYMIPFTELGLKISDLKKSEGSLKINNDLVAVIKADNTLELLKLKRNYNILFSITQQNVYSDLKYQNLALGNGKLIAVAFDGTLVGLNDGKPNKTLFKPSDKTPDNKSYWKQYNSNFISAKGDINYGVKYDGSLWYMGINNMDLIKQLKFSSDTVLYKIGMDNDWSTITLTEYSAIGLKTGGQMYGWGYNNPKYYNTMQDLSVNSFNSPVRILKDVNFKDFSFNGEHVLALSDKDELHFWGRGETNSLTRTVFKKKNILPANIKTNFKDKEVDLTYLKNGLLKEFYKEPSTNYLLNSRGFSEVQSNLKNSTLQGKIRFNDLDIVRIKTIFKNQELIQGKKLQTFYFADEYNNTSYYFGELDAGVVNYKDNSILRERTELIPNGYGILYSHGNIYEGFFKNGKLSGIGIVNLGDEYDNVNQVSYIGEFKEGKLNGFAKKVWPDGTYYEGQWNNNNLINGTASFKGEFTYSGEMSYKEQGLTDNRNLSEKRTGLSLQGKGELYTVKGDTLIGDFQNGQIIGKGRYLTLKYTYEGNFESGIISGYGIQKYRNGSSFTGEWVDGIKEGIFSETTSSGITKKAIWSDDKVLIDENSPKFSAISNLSPIMLKLYLINEGKFLSSLTNGYIYGGKSAISSGTNASLTGTLNVNSSDISVCDIQAIAGVSSYRTINCVNLVSFQRVNGNVYLEFSGSISKKKNGYSVQPKINSQGKLERKIVEGDPSFENKTLKLTININPNGQVNAFSMCFLDDRGYPDCGMGAYSGSLSKK